MKFFLVLSVSIAIGIVLNVQQSYGAMDEDLVALWSLDEGAGDTVKDLSGNGNDGKIVGANP